MKSKIFIRYLIKSSVFLFLLTMSFIPPLYSDEPVKKGDNLLSTIIHMESLLMRPCDKVEGLMNDLITYGRGYQVIETDRAKIYSEWAKEYGKYLGDFISVSDEKGAITPGKFMKRFLDLQKQAEDAGILADGPRPNVGMIQLVHTKDAKKYFYFEEIGSSGAIKKLDLRYKLEDEYEKLVKDWNRERDEFYKQFEDKGVMNNYAKALEEKTKEGKDFQKKYTDLKAELTSLALSGDYEHCLGEIKLATYAVQRMGDGLINPVALYIGGEPKTPESLPGMGYQIVAQKLYKPITKPEIGEFPLGLHLKLNGKDYFKFEKDILEIKIKAEEEETKILGFGMGRVGEFAFKTVHKTTESLAAPVMLVKYVVEHPVDSTTKAADFLVGLPKAIGDIKPFELNRKVGDFVGDAFEKLAVSVKEIAQDINPLTWNRFEPKPNETSEQEIERLKAKLDSYKKVKEGIDVASTITSIVAEVLLDKGISKGLGKIDDAVAAFKQESKLKSLISKVDNLDDGKSIVGKVDDITPDNKKALQDLLKEQSENSKEFSKFLTGDKPLEKGARLGDDMGKKIGAVDAHGQPVQIRAGDQLGKPGGFNTAYVDADDSNLVIRKTNKPMTKEALEEADAHDRFGRQVLEKEVNSSALRVAKMEGEFYEQTANGLVRYQKVERVSDTALDQVTKQGGSMTKGQQLALEQAHRDLNNSGYVWMDNTPKNYSFEKLPGGEDRWRVVVIDPDGIYPIKDKNPVVAKAFQETVDRTSKSLVEHPTENYFAKLMRFDKNYKDIAKGMNIDIDINNAIDWDRLKKVNPNMVRDADVSSLHWAPDAERLEVPKDIKNLGNDQFREAFDQHRYGELLNDPKYKELVEKQKELNKKVNDLAEKVDPQIKQAEKTMDAGPKPPEESKKPSFLSKEMDKETSDKLQLLSQGLSSAINAENCAIMRQQVLSGYKEEWMLKAMESCQAQGF